MTKRLTTVQKLFNQIARDESLLNDRREYDADMLAAAYEITEDDAVELARMIAERVQSSNEPVTAIDDAAVEHAPVANVTVSVLSAIDRTLRRAIGPSRVRR